MKQLRFHFQSWPAGSEVNTYYGVQGEITRYTPASPPETVTWTRGSRSGAIPIAHEVNNVTESYEIALDVEDDVAFYDAVHAIEGALNRARYWAESNRPDERVEIQIHDISRHDGGTWFSSPLYGGRVEVRRGTMSIVLHVERAPYWEGDEEPIQVMNTSESWVWKASVPIYNHDDGEAGHDNWVFVHAPPGDTPTPPRIRIRNTYDERRLSEVRIGWYDRPAILTLEGETATLHNGVIERGAQYSNEAHAQSDWFKWSIEQSYDLIAPTGTFLVLVNGDLRGGQWTIGAGYELTPLITLPAVEGRLGWTELGFIQLPPGGYTRVARYPMNLWLTGSGRGWVDYLLLLPLHQYRHLKFIGYNAIPGACIVDDGIIGETYYQIGGRRLPILHHWGERITLWPRGMMPFSEVPPGEGRIPQGMQMLTFTLTDDALNAPAMRTAEISLTVRPRWRTLP